MRQRAVEEYRFLIQRTAYLTLVFIIVCEYKQGRKVTELMKTTYPESSNSLDHTNFLMFIPIVNHLKYLSGNARKCCTLFSYFGHCLIILCITNFEYPCLLSTIHYLQRIIFNIQPNHQQEIMHASGK